MPLNIADRSSLVILIITWIVGFIILMLLAMGLSAVWGIVWFGILPILISYILLPIVIIVYILVNPDNTSENAPDPYKIDPKDQEYQDQINLKHSHQPECVICQDNVKSTLLSCGHANLCHLCAQRIKKSRGNCPICQRRIKEIEEEFFTQREYAPSRDPESVQMRGNP